MARNSIKIAIEGGRDAGKVFEITEFKPMISYKLAYRIMQMALKNGGVEIPGDMTDMGLAGLGVQVLKAVAAGADWLDIEPILDELLKAVRICPDKERPDFSREVIAADFEEWTTIVRLQKEVIAIHSNF